MIVNKSQKIQNHFQKRLTEKNLIGKRNFHFHNIEINIFKSFDKQVGRFEVAEHGKICGQKFLKMHRPTGCVSRNEFEHYENKNSFSLENSLQKIRSESRFGHVNHIGRPLGMP